MIFVAEGIDTMKSCEWTPKHRSRALGLMQRARHSLIEIFKITNISKSTLGYLKKRGIPLNKVRSKHLVKLLPRDKQHIKALIHKNYPSHYLSLRKIIRDLKLNICESTVKLALRDLGYCHYIAQHCPFLKKKNRKQCLQFARYYAHITVENWKAYIFIDKMSVKVSMERTTQD